VFAARRPAVYRFPPPFSERTLCFCGTSKWKAKDGPLLVQLPPRFAFDGRINSLAFSREFNKNYRNSQAPPGVSPIGNSGSLFSHPLLMPIACGAGT
jgi:hypothetical protein